MLAVATFAIAHPVVRQLDGAALDGADHHEPHPHLKSRPWYTYLLSLPVMVPLFVLGFYRTAVVVWRLASSAESLLAFWFASFLLVLFLIIARAEQLGPDARYMLPALAPLAVLSAVHPMNIPW